MIVRDGFTLVFVALLLLFKLGLVNALAGPVYFEANAPSADLEYARSNSMFKPLYVFEKANKWNKSELKVCFLSISPSGEPFNYPVKLMAKIASTAIQWEVMEVIELDFGDIANPRICTAYDNSDIRVYLRTWPPAGHWSQIGIRANNIPSWKVPTLNLEGYDGDEPDEPYFTWFILHEFGHALGLRHEYQNPKGGCDQEFNWNVIYKERGETDLAKNSVDEQLRGLPNSSAYGFSEYDKFSVMRYYFKANYFLRGEESPCYGAPVTKLSDRDKLGIQEFYRPQVYR